MSNPLEWLDPEGSETAPAVPTVSRSDLERYAGADACPFAAVALERGDVLEASRPMVVGQEAHRIIGEAVALRVRGATLGELVDAIIDGASQSRPDVQADVCDALRPWAARKISEAICVAPDGCDRNPDDIIAFDEGEEFDRGGALALDVEDPAGDALRLVCEVDLLVAGVNGHELDLFDWKSGFMRWSSEDVVRSFQFGTFYSHLVFKNFPDCYRLNVHVVMPKLNAVAIGTLDRDRVEDIQFGRIMTAIEARHRAQAADVPARWPIVGKCETCPVLSKCPTANSKIDGDVEADPANAVREWLAIDARAGERMRAIKAHVKKNGPIELDNGKTFPGSSPSFSKTAIK